MFTEKRSADDVVFLLDVDNTLLDTDRITEELKKHLVLRVGEENALVYWRIFEEMRAEMGYADYLGALQRFRTEYPHLRGLMTVSRFLINYPFANRLFPASLDVIAHLSQWGKVVIFSDGDVVFQPRKVECSGLYDAVERRAMIYVHKETELEHLETVFPATRYVVFDDKLRILTAIKKIWGTRVTTVFVKQGHYAIDPTINEYPGADLSVEHIGEVLDLDLENFDISSRSRLPSAQLPIMSPT